MLHSEKRLLTILATSDNHGAVYPRSYVTGEPLESGLAKVASIVKKERRLDPDVLVLDNGDVIQGTPLVYHEAKQEKDRIHPMVAAFHKVGYDAVVIGNHEFNYGLKRLENIVRQSSFPWLSANIVDEKTGQPYFGPPYLISKKGEVTAAVLGLTTPYIPNWELPEHIAGLAFLDVVDTAKRWVQKLREEEKADVVIVSYHGGFERDPDTGEPTEPLTGENEGYRLCEEVEGIDVLITGHQHREIAGKQIGRVVIVQPGNLGRVVGKVTLELHKHHGRWQVQDAKSELIPVEGAEADVQVLEAVKEAEEETQNWLDSPLGSTDGDMRIHDPLKARLTEHPFIEWMNRVQMEAAGVDISCAALFDNTCPGLKPQITMRDIAANYPFPNTLKVLRISGQDIREAIERSAAYFTLDEKGKVGISPEFLEPKPQHYNYDMWEGIEYTIDLTRPVGSRVTRLCRGGTEIDPEQEFEVVMNNYRASGGGHYPMFQGKPVIRDLQVEVPELLAEAVLKQKVIKAEVNQNWQVVVQ